MNIYTCAIDLVDDARALAFARAVEVWMTHLRDGGAIRDWRLYRRKLGLGSGEHRDFLLQIEVTDLAQLDRAFALVAGRDETVETLYRAVHMAIRQADVALYRPFPDPQMCERVALI